MGRRSGSPDRTPGVIETDRDIAEGVRLLASACPAMAQALRIAGQPPLRRWADGFAGLARIIVGQQLSTASANAIYGRLTKAIDPLEAHNLLRADGTTLRGCGLSTGKIATLRAAAEAIASGALDLNPLSTRDASAVRDALIAVKGIGPWTADIYLMFCRGTADAFAPGDLALQVGVQMLFRHDKRPSAAEIEAIAERWRPWRAVAARMIWAYYGAVKSGAGQPVSDEGAANAASSAAPRRRTAKAQPMPPTKGRRKPPARDDRSRG